MIRLSPESVRVALVGWVFHGGLNMELNATRLARDTLRVGDYAAVIAGPLSGRCGRVTESEDDDGRLVTSAVQGGRIVQADIDDVQRLK